MAEINITGKRFNRLVAIKFAFKRKKNSYWFFKCDCGKEIISSKPSVISGHTKSCGCLANELTSKRNKVIKKKHGMRYTRFYRIWKNMLGRTRCRTNYSYKDYGARGITVCKKWHKFEEFKNDMYESYLLHIEKYGEKQTTIERVNNNKGYNKGNCKWSTMQEQNRNKRTVRLIHLSGKTFTIPELSKKLKIKEKLIHGRLRLGWTLEDAISLNLHGDKVLAYKTLKKHGKS